MCLLSTITYAQQEDLKIDKKIYSVKTDSQKIRGKLFLENNAGVLLTKYNSEKVSDIENSAQRIADEDSFFNDIDIYSFTPEGAPGQLFPTIIMLSGGAFVKLDNQADLNPNSNLFGGLSLADSLGKQGYKVIWMNYFVSGLDLLQISKLLVDDATASTCEYLNNDSTKIKIEVLSLLSFHDFRKKLKNLINNSVTNQIDPANVFVAGISAGGILANYSVFLDSAEIPMKVELTGCVNVLRTWDLNNNGVNNNSNIRRAYYPIPPIKGIIPMAGGSFYNNIFSNNTAYTSTVAMNMMHGTCDELINQNQGRVSYKFVNPSWHYNTYSANRYPNIYASQYIYNLIQSTHPKASFCQVIRGGHSPITPVPSNLTSVGGGWDVYTTGIPISALPPSLNHNTTNPLYDNILSFMNRVRGVSSPAWGNTTYSMMPELQTTGCLTDNVNPITPPFSITAPNFICATAITATLSPAIPLGATISWTATSNVTISSPTSSSVNITRNTNVAGTATITATITYNGNVVAITKNIPIYPTLVGTMYNTVPFAINGVSQSISTPIVMPIGVPVNLSFTLPNATAMGVTDLQWLVKCGTVFTAPVLTWIGTSLKSEITVQYDTDSACQNLNVRPINGCGIGAWRIQQAAVQSLSILLSPNPANGSISIQLSSNYAIPYPLSFTVTQVNTGTVVRSGTITSSSTSVNTATLANGNYVVNVYNANISATANLVVQH